MTKQQKDIDNSIQSARELLRTDAQRARSIELFIIIVMTIATLAVTPIAVSLQWRELWILPFLFLGAGAAWVLHIRRLFTERARVWFYALVSWMIVLFDGMHTTSLYGIAIMSALFIILFSQTGERGILHVSFAVYLFLLSGQAVFIWRGESVEADSLVVSQLMLHTACVFLIYRIGLNIIRKNVSDRASAFRVIEDLTFTRRRTENFMANVSHELRTPVNVVTGLSSVMEERLTAETDRQDAAHILEAGKRLSDQVDDILDFTEIETGRLIFSEEPYMISSVVNDVLTSLGVYSRDDLPQVIVDVDAAIPKVLKGDARRIKKILTHLADNAIKFTRRGGVYINLYQMPQAYGINLCIEVRDTGIGMSREVLERLREGIYQEDAERNRENTGFGLGLRIVYGMVHAMNGFVRVESEPGEGTRVHVSLPQRVEESAHCMEIRDPAGIRAAFYQQSDKFETPQVRDFYLRMIGHVIRSFQLTLQRVASLDELKEMLLAHDFTHLFVADEEYGEEPAYFDALCKKMQVIVVARKGFHPTPFSKITILKKPLYAFPLVAVLNAEDEQAAKDALYEEEEVRFDNLRVLAVDDEEMNLIVARGIFGDYGMQVDVAHSGREAIDMARARDYDVIFMDHMMPVMDGVEAAHRIRDVLQTAGRRTRIIALTANAVSGAREMFKEEGFDGFVAKPIERTELERTLKTALRDGGRVETS